MTSARPFIFSPHYLFGEEHHAKCSFSYQEQRLFAQPIDITKGQLCIALDENSAVVPNVGSKLDFIQLTVLGRDFVLPCMYVQKVNATQFHATELHLTSEACEQSNAIIWEISYLLRKMPALETEVFYNESTLPKVPARGLYTEEARQDRLDFVREHTAAKLQEVSKITLDPRKLVSNIEALIGTVEIPVGVAGPLHIKGNHAGGLFYAPFATSEGALVASATRGATALSRSGGVTTRVLGQCMMRVPAFTFDKALLHK